MGSTIGRQREPLTRDVHVPNLPIKNSLESIGSGPMLRIRVAAEGEVREGVDSGRAGCGLRTQNRQAVFNGLGQGEVSGAGPERAIAEGEMTKRGNYGQL